MPRLLITWLKLAARSASTEVPIARSEQSWFSRYWHWIAVLLIILSAAAIRVHLLGVPLERDEGEYAYAGQLILQGIPPYAQVYNMKMPGIYFAYAVVMSLLGQTHVAIHFGLLVVNAVTSLLLFLLGRKVFSVFAGLTAAATFALLSMGQPVQGIFANAEHFVILPAVGGILLLLNAIDSNKRSTLLAGSFLLGLAFVMKQHGVAYIAFGGVYLFLKELSHRPLDWSSLVKKCLLYVAGVILPFALTCLIFKMAGVFDKFWFWTFDYASQYVSSFPFSKGLVSLKSQLGEMAGSNMMIYSLATVGLTSLVWNKKSRGHVLFTALFFAFSVLAVFPGFFFRPHYFVLLLPAIALLAGLGAGSLYEIFNRNGASPAVKALPVFLVLFTLFHSAWQQRAFLFYMSPIEASRSTYALNPFPESVEVASFLRENTEETDRIAVIGSEPQIYFYANRRSATGYIYTYALMENHPYALTMQQEMIKEIESAKPKFIVFVDIQASWLVRKNSERLIFEWFENYSKSHYALIGLVDIGDAGTRYIWGGDVNGYQNQSPFVLAIFKRND